MPTPTHKLHRSSGLEINGGFFQRREDELSMETAVVTIQASRHTGRTITAELSRLPIITGSFVPSIDQLFVILFFNLLDGRLPIFLTVNLS